MKPNYSLIVLRFVLCSHTFANGSFLKVSPNKMFSLFQIYPDIEKREVLPPSYAVGLWEVLCLMFAK